MANSNGKKKNGLTREQLEAAAEELNKEVVPQPQIDLEADDGLLKSQIKETTGIMVPEEDKVSPETQAVIDVLEADDTVIPTIDGEPQGEPEPAPTEPKEEDKTKQEEKDEGKEEDLVNLIKAAERIKELKPIVETKERFKSLRKKMAEGAYRKEGGIEELKADMLGLLGIGKKEKKKTAGKKKAGNGKKATEKKQQRTKSESNVDRFIAELEAGPKTMAEIKGADWNKAGTTFYGTFNKLIKEGKAKKDGKKLILLKK